MLSFSSSQAATRLTSRPCAMYRVECSAVSSSISLSPFIYAFLSHVAVKVMWLGELWNEDKTRNSSLVYVQLCPRSVLFSPRESTEEKSSLTCINTDAGIEINLYHSTHTHRDTHAALYPSWIWKLPGSALGDAGRFVNLMMSVYPEPTLAPSPLLVVFLPAQRRPGPSPVCLGWQWAQLFLSFVMHLQADL